MTDLLFVPQGGWGLVADTDAVGVYTTGMAACEPLAVCNTDMTRGAFCHLDGMNRLQDFTALLEWIAGEPPVAEMTFQVYECTGSDITEQTLQDLPGCAGINFIVTQVEDAKFEAGLYLGQGSIRGFLNATAVEEFALEVAPDAWNNGDYPSSTDILMLDPENWMCGGAVTSVGAAYRSVYNIFKDVKNGAITP